MTNINNYLLQRIYCCNNLIELFLSIILWLLLGGALVVVCKLNVNILSIILLQQNHYLHFLGQIQLLHLQDMIGQLTGVAAYSKCK